MSPFFFFHCSSVQDIIFLSIFIGFVERDKPEKKGKKEKKKRSFVKISVEFPFWDFSFCSNIKFFFLLNFVWIWICQSIFFSGLLFYKIWVINIMLITSEWNGSGNTFSSGWPKGWHCLITATNIYFVSATNTIGSITNS